MAGDIIRQAFADKPALQGRMTGFLDYYNQARAATNYQAPDLTPILEDIARYVQELRTIRDSVEEPAAKRRRTDGSQQANGSNGAAATTTTTTSASNGVNSSDGSSSKKSTPGNILSASWNAPTIDVSFSVPQRKKYALQISADKKEGIRALNSTSKACDFGIPWSSVAHILRLPVPEKAAASHNFCVFPKGVDGLSGDKTTEGYETMVWGASDARKRNEEDKPTESETLLTALRNVKAKVVEPKESEFVSSLSHPMRKNEKQYHVKAFRGSKEGFLFFLPTGIAFVFKKPLLFFAFDAIQSISYTSVLQRTFNLNISAISTGDSSDGEAREIEFSMLDQADFGSIDEYIKRHSLQDASMAAERKAKKYNVNKEQAGNDGDGGELEKAEQEANQVADDDDDEEDDENFDPGSEGESEGEGHSSDEDEDGDEPGREEPDNDEMDHDLVGDELGSEAEAADDD